jgi:hypothetical protein
LHQNATFLRDDDRRKCRALETRDAKTALQLLEGLGILGPQKPRPCRVPR